MDLLLSEISLFFEAFHFLRPLWLLLLLPLLAIWWLNRRAATRTEPLSDKIAPHLRQALTVGDEGGKWYLPIDHASLILLLAIVGAAGPTWTRQVDPFLAKTGPLVIALEVTPSMTSPDLPPDRLERAKFKIRDLLDLRAGGRTSLVAYAGSAHRVLPFTEDPQVMLPYLEGLSPDVMPSEGSNAQAALELATSLLEDEQAGGVLFVLDGLNTSDAQEMNATEGASVAALTMLPDGIGDQGLDLLTSVPVVRATANDADVARLDRLLNTDYRRAMLQNGDQPWEDRGWWLAIPATLLALIWFRQGWTMRWTAAAVVILTATGSPSGARAEGIADWFLTPDQQGYRVFQRNDFQAAADAFVDPYWKGYALYRAGRYDESIEILQRLETPDASFIQGMAHTKNRQYRDGVRAFETTLERDPDFPGAAENLKTAKDIVEYVEATREASDTGEERGIGADDVVFDNEAARGVDTQTEQQPQGDAPVLSAEQWMNTVDTSTQDFLRMRFQFEANAGQ